MSNVSAIIFLTIIAFILAKVVDFLFTFIKMTVENHRIISNYKQKLEKGEITKSEYYFLVKDLLNKP